VETSFSWPKVQVQQADLPAYSPQSALSP